MLKCKDIANQSSEFIEEKLSTREKVSYYLHLSMCGNCRRFIKQFRLMITQSKSLQSEPLADEKAEAIIQQVKHQCRKNDSQL